MPASLPLARARCRGDGHGRLSHFEPSRLFHYRCALRADTLFALDDRCASRSRASSWRQGRPHPGDPTATMRMLVQNRPLVVFASCLALFHLANAAMLPLTAGMVTMRSGEWAAALVGACILVPQVVVAALAPWIGRQATIRGQRPILLLGFASIAGARHPSSIRKRSRHACCSANSRRHLCGGACRAGPAHYCRRDARNGPFQSCARGHRHSGRYRCVNKHDTRRLCG